MEVDWMAAQRKTTWMSWRGVFGTILSPRRCADRRPLSFGVPTPSMPPRGTGDDRRAIPTLGELPAEGDG